MMNVFDAADEWQLSALVQAHFMTPDQSYVLLFMGPDETFLGGVRFPQTSSVSLDADLSDHVEGASCFEWFIGMIKLSPCAPCRTEVNMSGMVLTVVSRQEPVYLPAEDPLWRDIRANRYMLFFDVLCPDVTQILEET